MGDVSLGTTPDSSAERAEIQREAITMMLYVSVVEIAELAALPQGHLSNGRLTGPVGGPLLGIVWGTAVGLAIAHWFAFRLAATAFRGERPSSQDNYIGIAQVGVPILVAILSSVPVIFLSDARAQEFTGDVPALLVGAVGYLVARYSGKSRAASIAYGVTALALGVLVLCQATFARFDAALAEARRAHSTLVVVCGLTGWQNTHLPANMSAWAAMGCRGIERHSGERARAGQ